LPDNQEALSSTPSTDKRKKGKQNKKKSHYVAHTGFELEILLPQPPKMAQVCAITPGYHCKSYWSLMVASISMWRSEILFINFFVGKTFISFFLLFF
jgi:hypothetical protein